MSFLYIASYIPQRALPPSVGEPIRCFLYRKSRAEFKNRVLEVRVEVSSKQGKVEPNSK